MDLQSLGVMFNCFIVGGFVIPVINVAAGALGGALHLGGMDLDMDAGLDPDIDLDVGAHTGAAPAHGLGHLPFPVNLMTLSFTAVVFGAVGRLLCLALGLPTLPGILAAAFCGVLAGALLGRFVILPLKRNRAYATNFRRLRGTEAVVKLEIRDDFVGTVALPGATGSLVTYSARPAPGFHTLPIGQKVIVVGLDVEKEICVVQPLYDKKPEETQ